MAVFEEVYEQYGKPVYRFLLSLTGEQHMAEDLLQETFYQAFLHIDQFEGRSSLYTWLCQIGKHAWLKECRRGKHFDGAEWESHALKSSNVSVEEQLIQKEQYRRIRQAVYHLKEPYQGVFIMHVFGELKLKEIALTYEKTESWARVTYHRARAMILQEVEGE
ncbi:MAG: RNA polymerase sigma factor [Lachnospiraceae bacterium]